MYPKLDNLTHHYSWHPESRVRWKAKQNIDFAFLWLYVYKENMTQFYLHLEDDEFPMLPADYLPLIFSGGDLY
jgi:hypothetical protein